MTTDFKDQLKQQADIVRIIGDYVQLRKSGAQNFSGLCPFHKEKSASFSVHATKQFFYCFGCHAKGDVFEFVQKVENITFGEAVRLIAQKIGVPMPKVQYGSPEEQRQAGLRMQLVDINERACAWFQEQLRKSEGANAREYLAGRGLTPEIIAKFRIGFAPESGFLLRDAVRGQFDEEVMKQSGLFAWKDTAGAEEQKVSLYAKFRNRVMFPICNEQGKVIAFTGRTLATDEKAGPKYLNSPETPIYSKGRVLFNLDKAKEAIRKMNYAILVEGQMDCISVYAANRHNVIASSGTAFTDVQARLLARYAQQIVVNFDPDNAGAAATERTLGLLVEEDYSIKVLSLEQGFDPDLFIRKKGIDAYDAALRAAPKYFDYLIERAQMKFPVRTPEGKVKAVNYLLPHIQRVPSRIARDEISNEISQKLGIDSAVLRQELKHAATHRAQKLVAGPSETGLPTNSEQIIVVALVRMSSLLEDSRESERDGAEENFDPFRQATFVLESERLHEGTSVETLVDKLLACKGNLSSLSLDQREEELLSFCIRNEQRIISPELLNQTFTGLRRTKLVREEYSLQQRIQLAQKQNDVDGALKLAARWKEIRETLRQY